MVTRPSSSQEQPETSDADHEAFHVVSAADPAPHTDDEVLVSYALQPRTDRPLVEGGFGLLLDAEP
jgi:hypothetical protein